MERFKLSNEVTIKTIALRMKKADSMIKFYKTIIGFILKSEENNLSFLGTKELGSQLLILEDVSYKLVEVQEEKTLAQFSLLIPTEDEFISVLRRIALNNYPIKKTMEYLSEQSVLLEDPDGNEIEIVHKNSHPFSDEKRELDIPKLLKRSTVVHKVLSPDVKFNKICLNVESKTEMSLFYQRVLGLSIDQGLENRFLMDNGAFAIELCDSKYSRSVVSHESYLGVDFFVSYLANEESMVFLKEHLEMKQMDFFIDKKMKILTIYDPSGIEWWFMRE